MHFKNYEHHPYCCSILQFKSAAISAVVTDHDPDLTACGLSLTLEAWSAAAAAVPAAIAASTAAMSEGVKDPPATLGARLGPTLAYAASTATIWEGLNDPAARALRTVLPAALLRETPAAEL